MPGKDDYAALVNEIGGGEKAPIEPTTPTEPAPTEPTEPKEPTPAAPEPTEPVVEEPKTPESKVDPKAPEPKKPDPKDNSAFAQMRIEKAKYEKAIKTAAEAEGLSVDEYLAKLEAGALEKRAQQMNVPPEILRRLEETEAKLRESEQERVRTHLAAQFKNVQDKFKLSDEQLSTFLATLNDQGFNFQNPLADYETLYRGMNYQQLLEQERQNWIAHSQKGGQSTKVIPQNGKSTDSGARRVETDADLDALLAEMNTK